jgi:hypothetical protein
VGAIASTSGMGERVSWYFATRARSCGSEMFTAAALARSASFSIAASNVVRAASVASSSAGRRR